MPSSSNLALTCTSVSVVEVRVEARVEVRGGEGGGEGEGASKIG